MPSSFLTLASARQTGTLYGGEHSRPPLARLSNHMPNPQLIYGIVNFIHVDKKTLKA